MEDVGLPTNHFIMPWVAEGNEDEPLELSLERLTAIDVASASAGFGVDIDLSDAPAGRDVAAALSIQAGAGEEENLFDAATGFESRRR